MIIIYGKLLSTSWINPMAIFYFNLEKLILQILAFYAPIMCSRYKMYA